MVQGVADGNGWKGKTFPENMDCQSDRTPQSAGNVPLNPAAGQRKRTEARRRGDERCGALPDRLAELSLSSLSLRRLDFSTRRE